MKTTTQERSLSTNAGESADFQIEANGKAFGVLIDKLYADKAQSITREIWSNALDAHIKAGCPERPFAVTFPNVFDANFRVRDYGVSLSHEDVMNLYATVFKSTKEETNDEVGTFGLGSKSPFAYTDTFTITAYLDGSKRYYAAVIGKGGVPTINFMGEEPTEEDNGIEVAFPVERSDIRLFAEAAKRVSHGFDVKPEVLNDDHFDGWPELDVLAQGDGWKMLDGAISGYRSQAYAKMGCVLYPINADAMDSLTVTQEDMLRHTFVIDFDIGELGITASREELSYGKGEPTEDSIRNKLEIVEKAIIEEASDRIAECESYFDACALVNAMQRNRAPRMIREAYKRLNWNGRRVVSEIDFPLSRYNGYRACSYEGGRIRNRTYRFDNEFSLRIAPKSGCIVFFEDTDDENPKRTAARIKKYAEENKPQQFIWVRIDHLSIAQKTLFRFMDVFDGCTYINVSDLPMPERNNSGRRAPTAVRVYSGREFTEKVYLEDDDFSEGGYYVPLERMQPVRPDGCGGIHALMDALSDLGARPTTLYGAPKSLEKKFKGSQWVNIYDYAQEWFATHAVDLEQGLFNRELNRQLSRHRILHKVYDYVDRYKISSNSPVHDVFKVVEEGDKADDYTLNVIDLARILNIEVTVDKDHVESLARSRVSTVAGTMETFYPMINLMDSFEASKDVDKVTDYVIMCDSQQAPLTNAA